MDNIIVADTQPRVKDANLQTLDKEAGVAFCSFNEGDKCKNSSIQNSIAVGNQFAGFVAPGHNCGDTISTKFRNNVGHSNQRTGAHIYPDPAASSHSSCYEGSNFKAYKNVETPLTTHYGTKEVRMSRMTFIDSVKGVSLNTAGEGNLVKIRMSDSEIFGELDVNEDCTDSGCWCPNKYGLMLF